MKSKDIKFNIVTLNQMYNYSCHCDIIYIVDKHVNTRMFLPDGVKI